MNEMNKYNIKSLIYPHMNVYVNVYIQCLEEKQKIQFLYSFLFYRFITGAMHMTMHVHMHRHMHMKMHMHMYMYAHALFFSKLFHWSPKQPQTGKLI